MWRRSRLDWVLTLVLLLLLPLTTHGQITVSTMPQLINAVTNTGLRFVWVTPGTYAFDSPLIVSRRLSILGNVSSPDQAVVFTGQGKTRLFETELRAEFTLRDVTLRDGRAGEVAVYAQGYPNPTGGGCVAAYTMTSGTFSTATTLTFDRVRFERCNATVGHGGAVMMYTPFASSLYLNNCTFVNNSASANGGAVYAATDTVIPVANELVFVGTTFSNNMARNGLGGAVYYENEAFLQRNVLCMYNENLAIDGGAVYTKGTLEASRTCFKNNTASRNGAAVFLASSSRLQMDNETAECFQGNNGVDGYACSSVVKPQTQVDIIRFTSAPTPSPVTPAPFSPVPFPTQPPPTIPPVPMQASNQGMVTIVASSLTTVLLFGGIFAAVIIYRRRNDAFEDTVNVQRDHAAHVNRRKYKAKYVVFKEIVPLEFVEEQCQFCMSDTPSSGVVALAVNSLSAKKAKLKSPEALATTYVRLLCDHVMHAACVINWVEYHDGWTCPQCRAVVALEETVRSSSDSSLSSRRLSQRNSGGNINISAAAWASDEINADSPEGAAVTIRTSLSSVNPLPRNSHNDV